MRVLVARPGLAWSCHLFAVSFCSFLWSRASCLAVLYISPSRHIFIGCSINRFYSYLDPIPEMSMMCVLRKSSYPRIIQKGPPAHLTPLTHYEPVVRFAVRCYRARGLPTHPPSRQRIRIQPTTEKKWGLCLS